MRVSEKKSEKKREIELQDVNFVLNSPEGRRFYWRVLEEAGVFRNSYTGESSGTMFNEGRRSVGLSFFKDMFEANPNAFTQMQREHDSRKKMDDIDLSDEVENKTALNRS